VKGWEAVDFFYFLFLEGLDFCLLWWSLSLRPRLLLTDGSFDARINNVGMKNRVAGRHLHFDSDRLSNALEQFSIAQTWNKRKLYSI
jgi:hypothetical protein